MKRRMIVVILVAFVVGVTSYRLLRKKGALPPSSVEAAPEPAPNLVESTSISMESSTPGLAEPFLEVFEADPEALFELRLDEKGIERLREQKRSAWIDVTSYSAIAYEITMREAHFGYLGIRWKINGRETTAHKKL